MSDERAVKRHKASEGTGSNPYLAHLSESEDQSNSTPSPRISLNKSPIPDIRRHESSAELAVQAEVGNA